MKKTSVVMMCFLVMASLAVAPTLAKPAASCPITQNTDFVYYSGSGAGSISQSWMVHFLDWWKAQDSSINYMDLSAAEVAGCTNLQQYADLDMYIQPGGDAYLSQRNIGSTGKANINNFIANGGNYFGVCAGWYFAAPSYYWQDSYYDWSNLLGAYPVTVEGSIREIADYDENPAYTVTQLDNGFNAIYYGGPTVGYEYTSGVLGDVDARYTYMNLPAVVKYNGNMLLTSVHLEAFENDGITGLSTEDRVENYKYLANLINEVAGTNFYVPAYTNPPGPKACDDGIDNDGDYLTDMADPGCESTSDDDETDPVPPACNDGIDNDGDLLVDYPADPGCSSLNDEDETDVTGPVELVNDGFESGMSLWSVSGSGATWSASTVFPYEGSYSVYVKKTGVDKPTYMETSFDASAFDIVTFEYQRRLVGLDAADEFSAEYYNGAWYYVENLGSSSENNDAYVAKSFNIPTTATKIRFMCECGAVSEYCYVDNVKVIGE
jgi:glutamine amidotransferase-like uncharacterized protein